jgi:hypothetical protein
MLAPEENGIQIHTVNLSHRQPKVDSPLTGILIGFVGPACSRPSALRAGQGDS